MQYALITGACGGIGRALCDVFNEEGYSVIGVDCRTENSFRHSLLEFDITTLCKDGADAALLLDQVDRISGGKLDVLINNAATQVIKPFTQLTVQDWESTMGTNLTAPFWLIRQFYPHLKAAHGSVVNIASIHANLTKKYFAAYATSKGGLVTMTKALALELAPEVRINAVVPAATDTPMLREGFIPDPTGFAELEQYHPLGAIASPTQVARAALFLAGKQAEFITGSALNIDGGISSCLSDPSVKNQGVK
jgi:NAD(P)-dependent dehydrogenase (short-subunit alcohol dehydrogenase family)